MPSKDSASSPDRFPPLLSGAPFDVINRGGEGPIVLVCDHAARALPAEYGTLGLREILFEEHIAYDIGAADITRRLAKLIDSPAVLSRFSRLLIDPNRAPDHEGLIPVHSDGVDIPGNFAADTEERLRRKATYYDPYHQAIESVLAERRARGIVPAVVGIHTFTPIMQGAGRPWEAGILWNRDPRLAEPLLAFLRRDPSLTVGDNLPYSGKLLSYSLDHHGGDHGLPNVVVEVRQDLVDTRDRAFGWADLLAEAFAEICLDRSIFRVEHY